MKKQKGITLVALIITIIILLILAIVSINLVINGGIIGRAEKGIESYLEAEIKEKVNFAYNEWKMDRQSGGTSNLEDVVENRLKESYGEESVNVSKAGKGILVKVSKSGKDYEYTLIDDGTTVEGQLAYLDIADGNIDLYENGYKQYTGNLQNLNKNGATECNGKYIITGTTTENCVRVCDIGTFDITIKDLKIDISNLNKEITAFNANKGVNATGCYVTLTLEGNNYLKGGGSHGPGIGFTNATPNVDGVTNGSTLTIQGNGSVEAIGTGWAAGIGSGYTGFDASGGQVSNIIIDSGNITAKGGSGHSAGIGGCLYSSVNNIIINNGNINAQGITYGAGIGGCGSTADNIIINGGNIYTCGGYLGVGIGSISSCVGKVQINGGKVVAIDNSGAYGSAIGGKCSSVIITGGTIKATSKNFAGISCREEGSIQIIGGSILAKGKNYETAIHQGTNIGASIISYTPTNGTSNLYLTQIKLQGEEMDKQITKLTTSDNINYGIKDMYTLEDGMLYLYLPLGTRTINVEVDGNTYSGTGETKETAEVVTLNKVN